MKFICIDDGAVNEIISGRQLQSIDFIEGRNLIKTLKGETHFFKGVGSLVVNLVEDGMYLATPGHWKGKKFLVVDCETSDLFGKLRDEDSLTSFQKILRFCVKYWSGNNTFNASEKMIAGTSKTILFPLPFSARGGFRVAIDREPMKERLSKRELDGHFLLVYKSGYDGADSATEEVSLNNFRKVVNALQDIYATLPQKIDAIKNGGGMSFTDGILQDLVLSDIKDQLPGNTFLPLKDWLPRLTANQIAFINSPPDTARRLIGAAGTGKTTTLIVRTLLVLMFSEQKKNTLKALFVTHSEASKQTILEMLEVMDPLRFSSRDPNQSTVSLSVKTLAELCADLLSQSISETEFVDSDAEDSKVLQQLYIEQALKEARGSELKTHSPHMSARFRDFINENNDAELALLFQHEIGVQIKGRAGDSFDIYKECPPLKYGLPVLNAADKGFVFSVFRLYQKQLEGTGQFDTDDVVLSAIGQLDTPIWRRRRIREGYDFIAVDEAHLFNINELHVFHYFTKQPGSTPISFAVDQAQAVGDRGWELDSNDDSLQMGDGEDVNYNTVFRSSSEIINFSSSVLASGASLFANFKNSLKDSQSGFTSDDEIKAQPVKYYECADDQKMIEYAFSRASSLAKLTDAKPWEVLITCLSPEISTSIQEYALASHKAVSILDRRGDYRKVLSATKSGHMLIGHADFVGGLEFKVVVIVAVDRGRVPYEGPTKNADSKNFMKYVAHNRLYVAASRAKLALELLGVKARGPSDLLANAFDRKLISKGVS